MYCYIKYCLTIRSSRFQDGVIAAFARLYARAAREHMNGPAFLAWNRVFLAMYWFYLNVSSLTNCFISVFQNTFFFKNLTTLFLMNWKRMKKHNNMDVSLSTKKPTTHILDVVKPNIKIKRVIYVFKGSRRRYGRWSRACRWRSGTRRSTTRWTTPSTPCSGRPSTSAPESVRSWTGPPPAGSPTR